MVYGVVLDIDVFTRTCCHTCCACATLHADTIITSIYHIVYDEYILTAGDINRITVLGIPRTFYGDSVDNHILASGRDDMEFRTIQKCNSLYEHILATGESDHVCSGFLLFVHILSHIRFVLQIERIPDVTLLIQCSAHSLEFFPFYVTNLTALYRSPPFSVSVNGALACDRNIFSLAGIDGWSSTAFFLSCGLVYLEMVILVFRKNDDGILFQMQVNIVLQ